MPTQTERTFRRLLYLVAHRSWPEGHKLPASRKLQSEFGVSHGTMIKVLGQAADSQLLHIRPRQSAVVLPGADQRARHLLQQMGARPGGEEKRIAILVPEAFWPIKAAPFWSDLLDEVNRAAQSRKWHIEPICWPLVDQVRFSYDLVGRNFDAAFATLVDHSYLVSLHILHRQRFPTLLWNRRFSQVPLPSVLLDDQGGLRNLAELLYQSGHRNICFMLYVTDRIFQPGQQRYAAWRAYLEENDLLDDCIAPVVHISENSDLKAVAALLQMPQSPTALIFGHGAMCEEFLRCGLFNHLRIPQDLSLVTFDWVRNLPGLDWCPQLTHVQPNVARSADCIMEMFEKMFQGELSPANVRMPLDLHVGESIASPNSPASIYLRG